MFSCVIAFTDHQCPIGDFMCASDGDCIPENWRCDEEMDCEDGTDERNCECYFHSSTTTTTFPPPFSRVLSVAKAGVFFRLL